MQASINDVFNKNHPPLRMKFKSWGLALSALALASCGALKNNSSSSASSQSDVAAYVQKYAPIARKEMKKHGIPASITLAQGILESGSGKSELARKSNNHFGIKCHNTWNGKKVYHDDDEKGECFRKYKNPKQSFRDHSEFLTGRDRYAFLFDYSTKNYKAWAEGLKKAGYATDPAYPQKLIKYIEQYDLHKYDKKIRLGFKEVVSQKAKSVGKKITPAKKDKSTAASSGTLPPNHIVQPGETLYSLSKRYETTVEVLMQLNGLTTTNLSVGQVLILPKK